VQEGTTGDPSATVEGELAGPNQGHAREGKNKRARYFVEPQTIKAAGGATIVKTWESASPTGHTGKALVNYWIANGFHVFHAKDAEGRRQFRATTDATVAQTFAADARWKEIRHPAATHHGYFGAEFAVNTDGSITQTTLWPGKPSDVNVWRKNGDGTYTREYMLGTRRIVETYTKTADGWTFVNGDGIKGKVGPLMGPPAEVQDPAKIVKPLPKIAISGALAGAAAGALVAGPLGAAVGAIAGWFGAPKVNETLEAKRKQETK